MDSLHAERPLLPLRLGLAALCLGLPACTVAELSGEEVSAEDERSMPLEDPPMIAKTQTVPSQLETLSASELCVELQDGEALLGVDPNGVAWLALPKDGAHELRAFDYREDSPQPSIQLELAEVVAARFLGERAAAFLGPDALWSFNDGSLRKQALSIEAPSGLCGDPTNNGAVLAAGHFSERRGDEWWAWDPQVSAEESLIELIDVEGECYDSNDGAWLLGADARLWRVTLNDTQRLFSEVTSVAATARFTGVLAADSFYFGREDWQRWTFPEKRPERVLAGGDVMWLQEDAALLRFDGEEFLRLEHSLGDDVAAVRGHAGGLWIQGEKQLCHYETQESLRIEGIRPGERAEREAWLLDVDASGSSEELRAWLNGEELELGVQDAEGRLRIEVASAAIGWNEMRLVQGSAERSLSFRREPSVIRSWQEDIETIAIAACVDCHSPGREAEKSPLETYEQWVASAAAIRKRVVQTETMPPLPESGWEKDMQVIAEWLESGTNP